MTKPTALRPLRNDAALFRNLVQPSLFGDEDDQEVGFMGRAFVLATLPHSEPATNEFTRDNGFLVLSLMAPESVGLPYGRYPRLGLAYLTSLAVKTKSRELPLGPSPSAFTKAVGLTAITGKRGTICNLLAQLNKLVSVTISCSWGNETNQGGAGYRLAARHDLFTTEGQESYVVLSAEFFEEITSRPVPIDLRVIQQLRSPLAIDLYNWLTYKSIRLQRIGHADPYSWSALQKMFGADYKNRRHFKSKVVEQLHEVLKLYPAARVSVEDSGLVLRPYGPSVPRLFPGYGSKPSQSGAESNHPCPAIDIVPLHRD